MVCVLKMPRFAASFADRRPSAASAGARRTSRVRAGRSRTCRAAGGAAAAGRRAGTTEVAGPTTSWAIAGTSACKTSGPTSRSSPGLGSAMAPGERAGASSAERGPRRRHRSAPAFAGAARRRERPGSSDCAARPSRPPRCPQRGRMGQTWRRALQTGHAGSWRLSRPWRLGGQGNELRRDGLKGSARSGAAAGKGHDSREGRAIGRGQRVSDKLASSGDAQSLQPPPLQYRSSAHRKALEEALEEPVIVAQAPRQSEP